MSISVIVPTYNAEDCIFKCAASLLMQRLRPNQVVFVDDGSTDKTAQALEMVHRAFAMAGVKCTIVEHGRNNGRGAARGTGLRYAECKYVLWLDVDDLFHPDRLANFSAVAEILDKANDVRPTLLSSSYTKIRRGRTGRYSSSEPPIEVGSVEDFIRRGLPTPQLQATSGLQRTFEEISFDPDLNWSEDYDFALRFLAMGGRYFVEPNHHHSSILYFQSFDTGRKDLVWRSNLYVINKNRSIIESSNVKASELISRKWVNYISRFPSKGDALELTDGACHPKRVASDVTCSSIMKAKDEVSMTFAKWFSGAGRKGSDPSVASCESSDAAGTAPTPHNRSCGSSKPSRKTFQPRFSRLLGHEGAIVVSFFGGADSYRVNAQRLALQLDQYPVDYEICECVAGDEDGWIDFCRSKIDFIIQQHRKHDRAIFWTDVDCQVLRDPARLLRTRSDFGAFLRNFRHLSRFDPVQSARLFHPGYLLFGTGARVQGFLNHLRAVDEASPPNATDDYVLQEAFLSTEHHLEVTLFSPDDIVSTNEDARAGVAVFLHTDSGNVRDNRTIAVQHEAQALVPERQIPVLRAAASDAMKAGRRDEAVVFFKRLRTIAPDDGEALTKLLAIYHATGNRKKYEYLLGVGLKNKKLRQSTLRFDIDRKFSEGKLASAETSIERLIEVGDKADRDFAKSRRYRHSFDHAAQIRGIADDCRPQMMWWEQPHPGNLGDIIGPYIVEKLGGIPPKYAKASPRILSVGSIIKFARAGDVVWGSGASARSQVIDPAVDFRAVRGPLSRQMVLDAGGRCPEVYGDPAWFLPEVFDCSSVEKKYRLGLVRHFSHAGRNLNLADDVLEIDIIRSSTEEIERFLLEMNACESIVSTSLHGLIIAHAYGIPAALAVDTQSATQIHGDGMKFLDYFMSVGVLREIRPLDLSGFDRITPDLHRHCVHNPEKPIDLKALTDVAPFEPLKWNVRQAPDRESRTVTDVAFG